MSRRRTALVSIERALSSSRRKETSSWNRSLDTLSRREEAIRKKRGRNWSLVDREPRVDHRGAKVYHARMEARLREAVQEVLDEWIRADGVLASIDYEVKLSPDKRQAIMKWSSPIQPRAFGDVFGKAQDDSTRIEKYFNRRVVQLRYDVTRRLNFKFSPEFLIFKKKERKNKADVDYTVKRDPFDDDEYEEEEELY